MLHSLLVRHHVLYSFPCRGLGKCCPWNPRLAPDSIMFVLGLLTRAAILQGPVLHCSYWAIGKRPRPKPFALICSCQESPFAKAMKSATHVLATWLELEFVETLRDQMMTGTCYLPSGPSRRAIGEPKRRWRRNEVHDDTHTLSIYINKLQYTYRYTYIHTFTLFVHRERYVRLSLLQDLSRLLVFMSLWRSSWTVGTIGA